MIRKIDSNKFSLTILKVTTFSRIRQFYAFWRCKNTKILENTQIFLAKILENTQIFLAEILENTQIFLVCKGKRFKTPDKT